MESKKSFLLRVSPEMWNELEIWAQEEFRSVNGQIESIINEAIASRRRSKSKKKGEVDIGAGKK